MKRVFVAAVLATLVFSGVSVWAQAESFIGTVKAVTGNSTVERGSPDGRVRRRLEDACRRGRRDRENPGGQGGR
jgi:hypothetical protein